MLELREGVLYRRWVSANGWLQWLQVIPPVKLGEEIMCRAYCDATGHLGVRKSLKQVGLRVYWKG